MVRRRIFRFTSTRWPTASINWRTLLTWSALQPVALSSWWRHEAGRRFRQPGENSCVIAINAPARDTLLSPRFLGVLRVYSQRTLRCKALIRLRQNKILNRRGRREHTSRLEWADERPTLSRRQIRLRWPAQRGTTKTTDLRNRTGSRGPARGGGRPLAATNRNSLSRGRMDRPASGAPCARQPHERLCAFQAGAHRRRSHHQTYAEDRWAELPDNQSTPLETSLALLEALHHRFVHLLRSLTPEQWKRTFRHPELGLVPLEKNLALYAWHGRHHVAHITELRKKMGW